MKSYPVVISLTVLVLILLSIACQAPSRENQVLGEVGGIIITADDLINSPAAGQVTNYLLTQAVIMLEARERGITLDQETYKAGIDSLIEMQGGREQVGKMLKEKKMTWDDFFLNQKLQALSQLIVEKMLEEPNEQEIENMFNQDPRYRQEVSRALMIKEEDVTLAQARESIIKDYKSQKQGELQGTLYEDLLKKHNAKNYLLPEPPEEETETVDDQLQGSLSVGEDEESSDVPAETSENPDESQETNGEASENH